MLYYVVGPELSGFDSRQELSSLRYRVQTDPGSYPMDTGALCQGIKQPGREADHSPPFSTEVKNVWRNTSSPLKSSWRSTNLSTGIILPFTIHEKCGLGMDNNFYLWTG